MPDKQPHRTAVARWRGAAPAIRGGRAARVPQGDDAERAVLAAWKMEVYIPIRTIGQITGALAVGSKQSREPYFESDIAYLTALADQTGVALQNARLFRLARRQPADGRSQPQYLEDANQQLHELDKLKSAFIGVITHELRSPFAALDFSMQLIQRHGLDNCCRNSENSLSNWPKDSSGPRR